MARTIITVRHSSGFAARRERLTYCAASHLVDPLLSDTQVKELYWATQYDKLSTLRGKYDPHDLFKNPQNILITAAANSTTSSSSSMSSSTASKSVPSSAVATSIVTKTATGTGKPNFPHCCPTGSAIDLPAHTISCPAMTTAAAVATTKSSSASLTSSPISLISGLFILVGFFI